MSHELIFLPHLLGQTWAEARDAAVAAADTRGERLTAARLAPWPEFLPHAADVLGQIVEYRGTRHRELLHPFTGIRLAFHGSDALLDVPYWYDTEVARKVCGSAYRLARIVESDIGLAPYDPWLDRPLADLTCEEFLRGYLGARDRYVAFLNGAEPAPPVRKGKSKPRPKRR